MRLETCTTWPWSGLCSPIFIDLKILSADSLIYQVVCPRILPFCHARIALQANPAEIHRFRKTCYRIRSWAFWCRIWPSPFDDHRVLPHINLIYITGRVRFHFPLRNTNLYYKIDKSQWQVCNIWKIVTPAHGCWTSRSAACDNRSIRHAGACLNSDRLMRQKRRKQHGRPAAGSLQMAVAWILSWSSGASCMDGYLVVWSRGQERYLRGFRLVVGGAGVSLQRRRGGTEAESHGFRSLSHLFFKFSRSRGLNGGGRFRSGQSITRNSDTWLRLSPPCIWRLQCRGVAWGGVVSGLIGWRSKLSNQSFGHFKFWPPIQNLDQCWQFKWSKVHKIDLFSHSSI
jgi:hypothetical protein